jgi:hypothetical protein
MPLVPYWLWSDLTAPAETIWLTEPAQESWCQARIFASTASPSRNFCPFGRYNF